MRAELQLGPACKSAPTLVSDAYQQRATIDQGGQPGGQCAFHHCVSVRATTTLLQDHNLVHSCSFSGGTIRSRDIYYKNTAKQHDTYCVRSSSSSTGKHTKTGRVVSFCNDNEERRRRLLAHERVEIWRSG